MLLLMGELHAARGAATTILGLDSTWHASRGGFGTGLGLLSFGETQYYRSPEPLECAGPPEGWEAPALPRNPSIFSGGAQSSSWQWCDRLVVGLEQKSPPLWWQAVLGAIRQAEVFSIERPTAPSQESLTRGARSLDKLWFHLGVLLGLSCLEATACCDSLVSGVVEICWALPSQG